MNYQDTQIGMEVVRTKGDYVVGRTGEVVERNEDALRVRVAWKGETKTWVSVDVIEPTSIPYTIEKRVLNGRSRISSKTVYVKK